MAVAVGTKSSQRFDVPKRVIPLPDSSPEAVEQRREIMLAKAKAAKQLDKDQLKELAARETPEDGTESKEITVKTRRGPTTMRVRIGEMVLFFADANVGATPAIAYVQAFTGMDQLTLMVCKGSDTNGGVAQWMIRKNVRHITNEAAQSPNMRRHGAWSEIRTSLHEAIEALEGKMATLLEVSDELANRLALVEQK